MDGGFYSAEAQKWLTVCFMERSAKNPRGWPSFAEAGCRRHTKHGVNADRKVDAGLWIGRHTQVSNASHTA